MQPEFIGLRLHVRLVNGTVKVCLVNEFSVEISKIPLEYIGERKKRHIEGRTGIVRGYSVTLYKVDIGKMLEWSR